MLSEKYRAYCLATIHFKWVVVKMVYMMQPFVLVSTL